MQNGASVTTARKLNGHGEIVAFIWSCADLLRGVYKQSDYGKVILPFTVLRRLDCVLESTKDKVLQKFDKLKGGTTKNLDPVLRRCRIGARSALHCRQPGSMGIRSRKPEF